MEKLNFKTTLLLPHTFLNEFPKKYYSLDVVINTNQTINLYRFDVEACPKK